MVKHTKISQFLPLVGERLCLNFANTTERGTGSHPQEWLHSYSDLINWASLVGILTLEDENALSAAAVHKPAEASAVFKRAIRLRGAIQQVFSDIAGNEVPLVSDLEVINNELSQALVWKEVGYKNDAFVWIWGGGKESLERILWPIAQSAAELLTSDDLGKLKKCANPKCTWLFVDISRNHRRRWCEMEVCGNQAKVREHYQRKKHGISPS